ncbi:hypothetical protein Taro_003348 [Colocasia esculenta]|uniref:Uncharacterized protein n=1 Tax=Colocasia esculenta TaxID=4460 RepID=A0A843TNJ2_COLES|nr:hypothetical protein [Colocasia esculenta]
MLPVENQQSPVDR